MSTDAVGDGTDPMAGLARLLVAATGAAGVAVRLAGLGEAIAGDATSDGPEVLALRSADGAVLGTIELHDVPGEVPTEVRADLVAVAQAALGSLPTVDPVPSRTRFLAMAQHKLKTPLAVLAGWSGTLPHWDRLSPEERTRGAEAMQRAAEELRLQLDDLLDEARGQIRAQVVAPAPLDLAALVTDLLGRRADDLVHPVRLDVPAACPPVLGDPDAVEQVVAHLLDNAAKYSPEPAPIRIGIAVDPIDRERLRLEVIDGGMGVEPGTEVFAPFVRGPHARRVARGTGLGLHIVRTLVDALDGQVGYEPAPGGGTTFWVTLPIAP